jgi:hypothetical protein
MTERERMDLDDTVTDPETDEIESTEAETEPQVLLGVMGQEQDVAR